MRYTIQELLSLREHSSAEPKIEFKPRREKPRIVRVLPDRDAVVSFRKDVSGSETRSAVKFVQDIDVPIDRIVHVFNLHHDCGWPHLKTFCRKAVGVEPMDVRMMRRRSPCEARLIFHSSEDAQQFLARVPANNWLRGSIPRFEIEYNVPAVKTGLIGRSSMEHRCCDIVDVVATSAEAPAEAEATSGDESGEEEVATAVFHDESAGGGKLLPEEFKEDAHVSCFKSFKMPSEECNIPVYSTALQPDGKAQQSAKKSKGPVKGGRAQGNAWKKGSPSLTGICMAHMTA